MNTFHLCILEADNPVYDGECESLIVPITDGQYGIQAYHRNMIAAITFGSLQYRRPGEDSFEELAIYQGIVKVEENDVLVLAQTAERPEEIDANRARAAAAQAKEAMLQKRSIQEYRITKQRMARELNRLRVSRKAGS